MGINLLTTFVESSDSSSTPALEGDRSSYHYEPYIKRCGREVWPWPITPESVVTAGAWDGLIVPVANFVFGLGMEPECVCTWKEKYGYTTSHEYVTWEYLSFLSRAQSLEELALRPIFLGVVGGALGAYVVTVIDAEFFIPIPPIAGVGVGVFLGVVTGVYTLIWGAPWNDWLDHQYGCRGPGGKT